jgi:hypothetical protein
VPRDDDPRVVIRLTPEDHAALKATAEINNIAVGALVRECAIRYASTVAKELRVSGKRLRRGRTDVESPGPRPPRSKPKTTPAIRRASELIPEGQEQYFLEHQAKLNEARNRATKGRKS